jgi:hypothetical protein
VDTQKIADPEATKVFFSQFSHVMMTILMLFAAIGLG